MTSIDLPLALGRAESVYQLSVETPDSTIQTNTLAQTVQPSTPRTASRSRPTPYSSASFVWADSRFVAHVVGSRDNSTRSHAAHQSAAAYATAQDRASPSVWTAGPKHIDIYA